MIKETISVLAILNPIMFFICTCIWAFTAYRIRQEIMFSEIRMNRLEHLVLYGDDVILNMEKDCGGRYTTKDLYKRILND